MLIITVKKIQGTKNKKENGQYMYELTNNFDIKLSIKSLNNILVGNKSYWRKVFKQDKELKFKNKHFFPDEYFEVQRKVYGEVDDLRKIRSSPKQLSTKPQPPPIVGKIAETLQMTQTEKDSIFILSISGFSSILCFSFV